MTKPLSAVELASVAVKQQSALLDDAKDTLARASKTRALCEADVSAAETAHATATQASARAREDDNLADAAGRANVRLQHAKADLARSVEQYASASAGVAACEANVHEAERGHELARLLAEHHNGDHERELSAIAWGLVDTIAKIPELVLLARQRLAEDAKRVARIHALGGPPELAAPDATACAGALALALASRDGVMPCSNPHELRWPLDLPSTAHPDSDATGSATKLVDLVLGSLTKGAKESLSINSNGRARLSTIGGYWYECKTKAEADRMMAAFDKAQAAASAREAEAAHHERLRARGEQERRLRGRPLDSKGRPFGPEPSPSPPASPVHPGPGRRFISENEWVEGEDIGAQAPKVH